jgi:hypothetical protein
VKPAACKANRESGSAFWPISFEIRWKVRHASCSANEASPAAKTWPDTKATIEKFEPQAMSDILGDSTPAKLAAGTCERRCQATKILNVVLMNDKPLENSCGT